MATVTFATNHADWEALYVGGARVAEGHSIGFRDWKKVIEEYNVTDAEKRSVKVGQEFPKEL